VKLFRSSEIDRMRLLDIPESGMGYQVIHAWNEPYVVFNATVLVALSQLLESSFTADDYDFLTGDPDGERASSLPILDAGGVFELAYNDFDADFRTTQTALAFNRNAIQPGSGLFLPNRPLSYYRFSAYYRDRRVERTGFRPGTYATTYNDLHYVPSGFAAVGRYALPNPASAKYVFQIVTFAKPDLMGTATPNYSQAGGGVEVYFKNAARNASDCSFMINAG
jgi:hypothetical protein